MQIFGLNSSAKLAVDEFYDCHVPKLAVEACELLYGKAHVEMAPWLSKAVPGANGERHYPWKMISKGHMKHPCFIWVCASDSHAWWVLQHALAICAEYTARYNKVSVVEYHLKHILAHSRPPSPIAYTTDDFEVYLSNIYEHNNEKVRELLAKTCTANPPAGCSFGILACDSSYYKYDATGRKDWVASYRAYYASKKDTFKKPLVHLKRKRQDFTFEE